MVFFIKKYLEIPDFCLYLYFTIPPLVVKVVLPTACWSWCSLVFPALGHSLEIAPVMRVRVGPLGPLKF